MTVSTIKWLFLDQKRPNVAGISQFWKRLSFLTHVYCDSEFRTVEALTYHNSKVAQMVKNNGPKCIWSSGTLVDQLETFWTISDKTWILALKTQSAFWLSQWITVRFTILGHFGPFGPPRNTDEPAIFGLFWSKKSSLGLSSLQMTNNDQNQGDVRRRIIQMVICNNPCCSAPLILVVVGTVLFANYQQWPK